MYHFGIGDKLYAPFRCRTCADAPFWCRKYAGYSVSRVDVPPAPFWCTRYAGYSVSCVDVPHAPF